MIRRKELNEYNKKVFNEIYGKYEHFQLGFFNNNHILILGQNPGVPFDEKSKQETKEVLEKKSFFEFEKLYEKLIKNSKIGEFIKELIGDNLYHISFTNIVKVATSNNEEPDDRLIKEFFPVTKAQIELLNPNIVLCLGKFVGRLFELNEFYTFKKINNITYFLIPHPSFLMRVGDMTRAINKIKNILDNWLKLHAITKVTNDIVYYRDIEFKKQSYKNIVENNFCFIETESESEFKSFDGKNLLKIDKSGSGDSTETYERHLTKKDIFYYNYIDQLNHSKSIRYMLFDIETNFANDVINTPKEVISIAFFDSLTQEFYALILKKYQKQNITTQIENVKIIEFEDEKSMLAFFFKLASKFDVLSGWYSNSFDIPYLLNRSKKIGLDLNEYIKNLNIKIEDGEVKIWQDSYILYDSLEFYKRNTYYNKPPSYSLDSVSKFLFGSEKLEHEGVDILWEKDLNKLIEYNVHDVMLLKQIVDSNNIINFPLQLQQICPQDFENVFFNSRTIENLLHHRYWKNKIYFKTKPRVGESKKEEYEGAAVLEPIAGTHSNVAVYDFASMYTNIYLSFNYSPDTLIGKKELVETNFEYYKKDLCKRYPELIEKFKSCESIQDALSQWILSKNEFGQFYFLPHNWRTGVLPALEKEMLNSRKYYKDIRDQYDENEVEYKIYDELQGQAKMLLNSIYGVAAYERFILFNTIIPASITSIARKLNSWIQKISKDNNLIPLYGDTDSVFISFPVNLSFEDFILKAKEFNELLNQSFIEFMQQYTQNKFVLKNQTTQVEFEKAYLKLKLTTVKKRYFGLIKYYKGKILDNEKISVTGFETRRDDTPNYFKIVLNKAYLILLSDDPVRKIKEYYKEVKNEIKNQRVEDLIIKMKLSRDMDKYEKTIPIHLRALRNSGLKIRRGEFVNMIYVVGDKEVIHYDVLQKQEFILDYKKYIENFFINKIKLIDKTISFHTTLSDFM